jgi:hypothetical protein
MHEGSERRICDRVKTPGGEAFCYIDGLANRYHMDNLSIKGAKLHHGPMIPVGKEVEVVIFAGEIGPVSLDARVARHLDGISLGIEFAPRNKTAATTLQTVIRTAQETDLWPTQWMEDGMK